MSPDAVVAADRWDGMGLERGRKGGTCTWGGIGERLLRYTLKYIIYLSFTRNI